MLKKIMSLVAIFIFIFMMLFTEIAFADRIVELDTSKADKGTLKILYENPEVTKAKLLIAKDGQKYYYDLSNSSKYDKFVLQMGNGDYTITVYENVVSTKYRKVFEDTVSVNIKEEKVPEAKIEEKVEQSKPEKEEVKVKVSNEVKETNVESKNLVFLQSTNEVNYENSIVAVKLAKDLTKNAKTDEEKAKIIHQYIIQNMKYDYQKIKRLNPGYKPDMDTVLADGKGICYDYSALYAGMLRSIGVQAKLIKGYSAVTTAYHAWNEVYLNGSWVIVDATYDSFMVHNGYSYNFEKSAQYYTTDKEF